MRWLPAFLSLACLTGGAFGAKKTAEERFNRFFSKSLSSGAPIKLDDASYKELTVAPRNYSALVLLTALEARFGCQLCREFQPEFDLLTRSWVKGDKSGDSKLVFSVLDFSDGRNTFLELGLQTAPVLLLFQPTVGPYASTSPEPIRYDFTNGPQSAEQVHHWLARHTPDRPHPPVKRPINWLRWISAVIMISGAFTAAFVAWPYIFPFIRSRNPWAAVSLILILLFTSGHMFNHIRKVPYVASNNRGGISYFAGGFQNQFGMETQIVAAIYGVLSFATICLVVKVPRIKDRNSQQVAVIAWSGVIFFVYSFLLSIFRIKNGGYPFSLPPFM
ncbi:hypothetical protein VTK73DRAFT_3953 [Phialemonium thermophilum]|uniref:Magnesium transporter protein 1 n=1 Tax=Phialemonium thermophilum TaxID=223376 RepID=A0ABR3Y0J0_9PEZI